MDGTSTQGASRRILVIEDNEDIATTLADLLELEGHEPILAGSGPEGLDAARRHRPDLVICDIGLPGMDGFEVAAALRANADLRSTVLVALSGYGRPEDKEKAVAAGFDEHLTKPVRFEDLEALLAR
ncbi:response regulator [Vulgatibacter sp.]|uniref:response regulator n=1 Tax=Vulgatibacter sp. TaxID=1971226 RepID=UPI003566264B